MHRNSLGTGIFSKIKKLRYSYENRRSIVQSNILIYGNDVVTAKRNGVPIVALESTIVTHGMPYPENLHTALKVEEIVREQGAVPATICILDGKVHVGASYEEIERLSIPSQKETVKCSRRDFPLVISQRSNGGTTVSGTMLVAKLADIPIMATGGIGGVHREAELTFDVSADLTELSKTSVVVVCAGVKAILDIPKTLEYLETQGVPVIVIGDTDAFPAFYCRETIDGMKAPVKVSNSKEAADLIVAHKALSLTTGMLFAVPIPKDHSLDPEQVELTIQKALDKAKYKGIVGKDTTPFLLRELNELTNGHFLQANKALIENNARIASEISLDLCTRQSSCSGAIGSIDLSTPKQSPVVIGGAIFDTVLQVKEPEIKFDGRTHIGQSQESCGGVARNIAAALVNLGVQGTELLSVVGNDDPGKAVIKSLEGNNEMLQVSPDISTARYTAVVNNSGECYFGIGEMAAFDAINPALINKHRSRIEKASLIVFDGNSPIETIQAVMNIAVEFRIPVWYEPTDIRKATKIFEAGELWKSTMHFISPNENELMAIGKYFGISVSAVTLDVESIKTISEKLAEYIPVIITTLGSRGVLISRKASEKELFYDTGGRLIEAGTIQSRLYKPLSNNDENPDAVVSVSGCGDCLAAGIISGIYYGLNEANCVSLGLGAAALSLKSVHPVPLTLSTLRSSIKS